RHLGRRLQRRIQGLENLGRNRRHPKPLHPGDPLSNRLKNIAPKISKAARLKVLTLDIETRPNLAHVWGLWQQNVGLSQIVERGHFICCVATAYGDNTPIFMSDHHDGHDAMIEGIWRLLDEADAVVTWNGVSFDMKHLRREFVLAGLTPPSPWKDID